MKCKNCGTDVPDGSIFCDNCGTKIEREENYKYENWSNEVAGAAEFNESNSTVRYENGSFCAECGAKVGENAVFCGECGASIKEGNDFRYKQADLNENKRQKSKSSVIIFVLILIILLLICLIGGYLYYAGTNKTKDQNNSEKYIEITASPTKEASDNEEDDNINESDTDKNEELETQKTLEVINNDTDQAEEKNNVMVDSEGYASYFSTMYKFECKYPSWFIVQQSDDSHFTAASPDGKGKIFVEAYIDYGATATENMNEYIYSFYGEVDYKSCGDDFFAVRIKSDTGYNYRFAKFKDGKAFTFSFEFPHELFETYDNMINYIYKDFIKQFR